MTMETNTMERKRGEKMKKFLGFLLVVTLILGVVQLGNAVTIGFDLISGNVPVTDQYSALGINFQQTFELDVWNPSFAPVKYPGDHIAYSQSYDESILLFDDFVDTFSLLVTSANQYLYLEAYDDGNNMLTSKSGTVPIGNWYYMDLDLIGLPAQKIIVHNGGGWFAFDNVEFTTIRERPGEIPEPSTLLLLCMGFIGFAGIKRRIHRKS